MELNLNHNNVFPLLSESKYTERMANKALDNILEPFPNIGDVSFDDNFNWEYKHPKVAKSYQLYLQSLRIVSEILNQYRKTENVEYVLKAKEITENWLDYIDDGNETEMTWYDHAIGARSQTLIDLLHCCQIEDIKVNNNRYIEVLKKHANLLCDDSIHRKNNHGIMMDKALITLGLVTRNDEYFLKGYERVKSIFWLTYSDKGVHLENSPEYHRMVYMLYKGIERYLNRNEYSLGEELISMFPLIEEYNSIIVKPDNRYPPIGDSSHSSSTKDVQNKWTSFSDSAAGISVIKNQINNVYLAFICGFSTITHKHSDDLSFILNYNKKDFFVDPGKFNYSNSKYRKYVVKRQAHNAFTINRAYEKLSDNKITKRIYTDHFDENEMYTVISGYNTGYNNASLRRTIFYLSNENVVIGVDEGTSKQEEQWNQNFNLSEFVEVEEIKSNKYKLKNSSTSIFITFGGNNSVSLIKGSSKSKWPKAINSPANGKIALTHQISYREEAKKDFDNHFVISFDRDKNVQIIDKGNHFLVSVNDNQYQLPKYKIKDVT